MSNFQQRVKQAITQLQNGGMVVIKDDHARENEGDLVIAAEYATAQAINFFTQEARGIVCLSLDKQYAEKLQLPLHPKRQTEDTTAPFTLSIDARLGIGTGVSAADRAKTIAMVLDDKATADDFTMPGHVFPLLANPLGVLKRRGHTEGSVDIMRLAGLKPAAVICEIMKPDGNMAREQDLDVFAQRHDIAVLSVDDIAQYRLAHEVLVHEYASAKLPTRELGNFQIRVFRNAIDDREITVLHCPDFKARAATPVRLHSACMTGDIFHSLRCDCGEQLQQALEYIAEHNGVFLYLPQEGRDIGLGNKIRAYALQELGLDTVEANVKLGFEADGRNYAWAAQVLKLMQIPSVDLLTNNPDKIQQLQHYGVVVNQRIDLVTTPTPENMAYLTVKQSKLHHFSTGGSL